MGPNGSLGGFVGILVGAVVVGVVVKMLLNNKKEPAQANVPQAASDSKIINDDDRAAGFKKTLDEAIASKDLESLEEFYRLGTYKQFGLHEKVKEAIDKIKTAAN